MTGLAKQAWRYDQRVEPVRAVVPKRHCGDPSRLMDLVAYEIYKVSFDMLILVDLKDSHYLQKEEKNALSTWRGSSTAWWTSPKKKQRGFGCELPCISHFMTCSSLKIHDNAFTYNLMNLPSASPILSP